VGNTSKQTFDLYGSPNFVKVVTLNRLVMGWMCGLARRNKNCIQNFGEETFKNVA